MWLRACLLDEVLSVGQVIPDLDHAALGLDPDMADGKCGLAVAAFVQGQRHLQP